jgi:hypothetical protein
MLSWRIIGVAAGHSKATAKPASISMARSSRRRVFIITVAQAPARKVGPSSAAGSVRPAAAAVAWIELRQADQFAFVLTKRRPPRSSDSMISHTMLSIFARPAPSQPSWDGTSLRRAGLRCVRQFGACGFAPASRSARTRYLFCISVRRRGETTCLTWLVGTRYKRVLIIERHNLPFLATYGGGAPPNRIGNGLPARAIG